LTGYHPTPLACRDS